MPKITVKGKLKRGYGNGTGVDYKSWIKDSEFNSKGTTAVVKDWKTGRTVHLLSQGEVFWYYLLRWNDDNIDIQEQYPLKSELYLEAARKLGLSLNNTSNKVHTTDFLVTKIDGRKIAYSVKASRKLSNSTIRSLCIEKAYWMLHGIDFSVLFKTDVKSFVPNNIRLAVQYYNASAVTDVYTGLLHKIARKEISFDMFSESITKNVLDRVLKGGCND